MTTRNHARPLGTEPARAAAASPAGEHCCASSSLVTVVDVCGCPPGARVAPKHLAGVRAVERPDVAARLELVDDARRPGVPDLETALQQRRRGAIVLLDHADGVAQEPVRVVVGEVVERPGGLLLVLD